MRTQQELDKMVEYRNNPSAGSYMEKYQQAKAQWQLWERTWESAISSRGSTEWVYYIDLSRRRAVSTYDEVQRLALLANEEIGKML